MADTTSITFTQNPLQELLALQGLRMEVGGTALQYAPLNNSNITDAGTLGWRNFGLLENASSFKQTLAFFDGEAGQIGKEMANIEASRKSETDVMLTCATFHGAQFALGSNNFTITEPATPVITTVSGAPATGTNFQLTVTSTTGFVAGDEIGISTGSAVYGIEEEFKIIKEVISSTVLNLIDPLDQLPIDTAVVRKIATKLIKVKPGFLPTECAIRSIKYNRSYSNRLRVSYAARAGLKDPTGIDDGNGKVAAKYGFKLKIMPDYNIATGDFNLFQVKWINP